MGWPISYNWNKVNSSGSVLSPIADYTLQYDNGQNRVARLTGIGGNTMTKSFAYDQLGRLTSETNGGTPQPFNYDLAGNRDGMNVGFTPTNQYPAGLGVTYDADGNTLSKNIGLAGNYTYDSAGHVLTQKNGPNSPAITYAYDNMGHRVKRTVGGVSTFYVFAGDTLIGETDASGNPQVIYTWGVNGLISARRISSTVTPPVGGGGATASASKGKAGANLKGKARTKPNNFATAKNVSSSKSNVVAKGKSSKPSKSQPQMKAAATMRAGATVNVRATASMGTPAMLKGVRKGTKASASVPLVTSQTYYYHFGPSGETKQLTDSSGNVTDTYSYTAYGVQTSFSGTTENPFRYGGSVGYYSDTATGNTGIILCTNRWYSPEMGRWLTRDPIGYAGGENLYTYCAGDPVNFYDPEGTDIEIIIAKGIDGKGNLILFDRETERNIKTADLIIADINASLNRIRGTVEGRALLKKADEGKCNLKIYWVPGGGEGRGALGSDRERNRFGYIQGNIRNILIDPLDMQHFEIVINVETTVNGRKKMVEKYANPPLWRVIAHELGHTNGHDDPGNIAHENNVCRELGAPLRSMDYSKYRSSLTPNSLWVKYWFRD
jgi:RHS repeat-associated protein